MGVESLVALPSRAAPRWRRRRTSAFRIGPLRTVAEAAPHPILSGIRSGALAGLAIVAVLGLPVLLILGVKPSAVPDYRPAARVWVEPAGVPVSSIVAAPQGAALAPAGASLAPAGVALASAEPAPVSAAPPRGGADRPALSVALIPVLDDASGDFALEEPQAPAAKPARPNRVPPAPRAARAP